MRGSKFVRSRRSASRTRRGFFSLASIEVWMLAPQASMFSFSKSASCPTRRAYALTSSRASSVART